MLRTIPILLLTLLLTACTIPAQAQTFTLDKCLDDLTEKQTLGPVVAVMHGPVEGTADLSSLEGLARTFGLKLFDQDGIHVLGPEMCVALYDIAPYLPKWPLDSSPYPNRLFLRSLTPDQLQMVGSPQGLHYSDLSPDQGALLEQMCSGLIELMMPPDEVPAGEELLKPIEERYYQSGGDAEEDMSAEKPEKAPPTFVSVALDSLPLEDVVITGRLNWHGCEVIGPDGIAACSVDTYGDPIVDSSKYGLIVSPKYPRVELPDLPEPVIPNVLKPSQLDYDTPELQRPGVFPVRTNLHDVVGIIAHDSGVPLVAGPGSEQIMLYVKADGQPISGVLKAISLAAGGTWRKVGSTYLFALDEMGFQTFSQRLVQYNSEVNHVEGYDELEPDPAWISRYLLNLPAAPGTKFALTPQQITDMAARLSRDPDPTSAHIPWKQLTREQQSFLRSAPDWPTDVAPERLAVSLLVESQFEFHFSSVGKPSIGYRPVMMHDSVYLLPACWTPESDWLEFVRRPWPKDAKVPMPSGIRGVVCKPSKSDTPGRLVLAMERYGLNTLLLRVFADGYTLFPSDQFPTLPGLEVDDFLRNTIAAAHSRGIRVIGVLDVLRWSDGDKRHWLYKNPEIIDLDVLGQMNTESAGRRIGYSIYAGPWNRLEYGDLFAGDFVSPFHPMVRQKLAALTKELGSYDLDGISFNDSAIAFICPEGDGDCIGPGITGFNECAREAFIRKLGIDPADICMENDIGGIPPTPASALLWGGVSKTDLWQGFYEAGCTALLADLIDVWGKTKPKSPVWLLDAWPDDIVRDHVDKAVVSLRNYDPDAGKPIDAKTIPLVRITDDIDLLYAASGISALQGKGFTGMLDDAAADMRLPADRTFKDIIFDFACSEIRKAEFLKLLETARPVKTR